MKRRFLYSEARLSEVTGISRTYLKKLRLEMPKGKEWRKSRKGKGGSIELSEKAVDIILKTLRLTDTDITRARLDYIKTAERTIDPKQETQSETLEGFDCMCCGRASMRERSNQPEFHRRGYCSEECLKLGPQQLTSHHVKTPSDFGVVMTVPHPLFELKTLKVTHLPPNIRIVHAKNGTEEYRVIVPNNKVWSIGDQLRAKSSERHSGFLELASKAPRWKSDRMYLFSEGFVP